MQGSSVKNLVARLMHQGLPGVSDHPHLPGFADGKQRVRPVVWQDGWGGPMTLTLVDADQGLVELGRVDHAYTDSATLIREIADANVRFGVPTLERLVEAFPNAKQAMRT